MSYCKAFAPCLRVTEGDRRVTGMTMVFSKPPNPLKGELQTLQELPL